MSVNIRAGGAFCVHICKYKYIWGAGAHYVAIFQSGVFGFISCLGVSGVAERRKLYVGSLLWVTVWAVEVDLWRGAEGERDGRGRWEWPCSVSSMPIEVTLLWDLACGLRLVRTE